MQVYMVVIVYTDSTVIIESVFADFDKAQEHCESMQYAYRSMVSNRVDYIYVTQGYTVQQ
jgi:hypothetical protein